MSKLLDNLRRYRKLHCLCPVCEGNQTIEQTCIGMVYSQDIKVEEMNDKNRASCGCGWVGTVHELTKEEETK